MATFPRSEEGIISLAQSMIVGLAADTTDYPDPPVSSSDLSTQLSQAVIGSNQAMNKRALAEESTKTKQAALDALMIAMKKNLRYAEMTVHWDDEKLKMIGWAGRHPKTPLAPPGQALNFTCTEQGPGTAIFTWEAPLTGGKAQSYRLDRRLQGAPAWEIANATLKKTCGVFDQPTGVTLEYSIVALNKAGEGTRSNSVSVVL